MTGEGTGNGYVVVNGELVLQLKAVQGSLDKLRKTVRHGKWINVALVVLFVGLAVLSAVGYFTARADSRDDVRTTRSILLADCHSTNILLEVQRQSVVEVMIESAEAIISTIETVGATITPEAAEVLREEARERGEAIALRFTDRNCEAEIPL
jgi:hypothetical protein